MPGQSCCRRLRSLSLCSSDVFLALINSIFVVVVDITQRTPRKTQDDDMSIYGNYRLIQHWQINRYGMERYMSEPVWPSGKALGCG